MNSLKQVAKYSYLRRLPHCQKFDAALFVTFCALARQELPEAARDLVLGHCLHDHGKKLILHAAVVMPNHVHLLLSLLRDDAGWPYKLKAILQSLKGASAHRLNKLMLVSGPVWQEESFDHVLRSEESLKEKREYIRQNPVRRGLVRVPDDYPWLWIEK